MNKMVETVEKDRDLIFWSPAMNDKANVVTQIPMASKS